MLFNILSDISPSPNLSLFADDTATITHLDIVLCRDYLQKSVNMIVNCFKRWRLNLNPTKCKANDFSLRQ